jgi:N-acetylneuraminic acid mutarotase
LESFGDVIYSFGGILQDKTKINSISTFDLANREWTELKTKGTPPSPRCDPITCAYNSGSKRGIIVFGGSQEGLVYHSDVHFFNVDTNTWEEVVIENDGPSSRIGATAAILGNKLYLFGGAVWNSIAAKYTKNYNEMWCLHLGNGAWKWELLPNLGTPPTGTLVNLTSIAVGHHLLIEGIMNYPVSFVYDTITHTWTTLCASGRSVNTSNFSSAVLVDDTIYYVCGYRNHLLAQDVVKLPIAHLLNYINKGTVPDVLREKKRLSELGEDMEACSDRETGTATAALDATASSEEEDDEEEEDEEMDEEEEDDDESMEQGEEVNIEDANENNNA